MFLARRFQKNDRLDFDQVNLNELVAPALLQTRPGVDDDDRLFASNLLGSRRGEGDVAEAAEGLTELVAAFCFLKWLEKAA